MKTPGEVLREMELKLAELDAAIAVATRAGKLGSKLKLTGDELIDMEAEKLAVAWMDLNGEKHSVLNPKTKQYEQQIVPYAYDESQTKVIVAIFLKDIAERVKHKELDELLESTGKKTERTAIILSVANEGMAEIIADAQIRMPQTTNAATGSLKKSKISGSILTRARAAAGGLIPYEKTAAMLGRASDAKETFKYEALTKSRQSMSALEKVAKKATVTSKPSDKKSDTKGDKPKRKKLEF